MKNNKFFSAVSDYFKRIADKDFTVKILSLVAAILLWFIVSINEYPTIETVVYNVPIVVEMTGTYAEDNHYQVASQSDVSANVYITGDRGQIGDIKSDDITIIASAENVVSASKYNLPLEVLSPDGKKFTVQKISSDTKALLEYVTVDFDEIISREISVNPYISNLKISSGYLHDVDEIVIAPNSVEITGPKDVLDTITGGFVNVDIPHELTDTFEYTTDHVEIYKNALRINPDDYNISIEKNDFTVNIPVYKKDTIPLEVTLTNVPKSFNEEKFLAKLQFSLSQLEIATTSDNIRMMKSLNIGNIDMREVNIGSEFVFKTKDFLPKDFQNLNNVDEITVTCPSENLYYVPITIDGKDIKIINAPSDYEFDIITSGFMQIFIGTKADIEQITKADVVAQIDVINYDLEAKDYKWPVSFSTPKFDEIWNISGDGTIAPKAVVTVNLKEEE